MTDRICEYCGKQFFSEVLMDKVKELAVFLLRALSAAARDRLLPRGLAWRTQRFFLAAPRRRRLLRTL